MKRYLLLLTLLALSLTASSQSVLDAINTGTNYYYGTARSLSMGNAFTAVGGDIGAIGINPAGGVVAGYSQATVTPSLTITTGGGSYAPAYQSTPEFGAESSRTITNFELPNVGGLFVFSVGSGSGLRSFSFGFALNTTNCYNDINTVSGRDQHSSLTGSRAYWSNKGANVYNAQLDPKCLSDVDNALSNYYWNQVTAYHGGLTNYDPVRNRYFGSAEVESPLNPGTYGVPGVLEQTMTTSKTGVKRDLLLNFAFDFNSRLFVGLNLGFPIARYNYSEYLSEAAVNSENFPITTSYWDKDKKAFVKGAPTQYRGSDYEFTHSVSSTGVYGKFGIIYLPTDFLRLGAAIQTPVGYSVSQTYRVASSSSFVDTKQNANSWANSNLETFKLNGPWEANFGVACTFGPIALLSVDYEMTDFTHMKYSNSRATGSDLMYSEVNGLISQRCGVAHTLRAGGEVNVLPFLALRAGYNLSTSAEQQITANVQSFSLGVGYKSAGSFFADLGARLTTYPTTVCSLYQTYIFDGDKVKYYAPEEKLFRRLWNVSLTFGWRF